MPIALTAEQQQRLLALLRQELREAADAAVAQGSTPTALAELLDERRAALGRLAGRDLEPESDLDPEPSPGQDHVQDRGDDPGELGRVAQ
ncbi:MAG TPA: hypothetical protein VGX23_23360 [Actinocrinis sp.]|nr:hypothetical protein [Actinocrinis sp.]